MKLRQSLFWDTPVKNINIKKHARYIAERIMDYGNDKEVKWMWDNFPKNLMADVIKKSHSLRPKTKALWRLSTS